jgi:hypothetical protein
LPKPSSYAVQSPCIRLDGGAKVHELIDRETGSWNTSLIQDIFVESEAKIICNLHLSRYCQEDKLI